MSGQDGCSASTRVLFGQEHTWKTPFSPKLCCTPCDTGRLVILQLCVQLQSLQCACCHNEQAVINVPWSPLACHGRPAYSNPKSCCCLSVSLSLIHLHGLHLAERCNYDIHCRSHSAAKGQVQKGCPRRPRGQRQLMKSWCWAAQMPATRKLLRQAARLSQGLGLRGPAHPSAS